MSIHDEAEYGWLVPEKRLIAQSLNQNKFVLGICLGSQLLADSRGSRVYRNRVREIGWFPIRLRPAAVQTHCFAGMPERMDVLHRHGETYDFLRAVSTWPKAKGASFRPLNTPRRWAFSFTWRQPHWGCRK